MGNIKIKESEFIEFLKAEGLIVKTSTKARGNLGIYMKNRIDISKNAEQSRRIAILAHEYAHKIHYDLEKENFNKGGTLEKIFNVENSEKIQNELLDITCFIDDNARFLKFYERKGKIFNKIAELERIITIEYPDFKRSQPFKPINSYFRKNKSTAKYLLKYDRVKIIEPIFHRERIISIETIDNDFKQIPEALRAYIKFKSLQREYSRLYRRKNKAEKYYNKPSELFARFLEGLFTDQDKIKEIAPITYEKFFKLLDQEYYGKLKILLTMAGVEE